MGERAAPAGLPTDTTSSRSAYVVPTSTGWAVVPLLTVGDNPQGVTYPMVGKPDGLGAIKGRISGSGEILETGRYLTVFMNHELAVTRGVARAHGTAGAFVSQWTLDLNSLRVVDGRDLIARTFSFTGGAWNESTGTLAFDRLCSADLPAASAFFNAQSGNGFNGRLFMNGEEAGTEGRAFAHIIAGTGYGESYELPHLGKYQRENVVSNPKSGDRTLVVGMDDTTPGQIYVYVGTKTNTGNAVQRAGLHGGRLYGIRVIDGGANYGGGAAPLENKGAIRGRFDLVDVSAYAPGLGTALQDASVALGVTEFARPEDGAWDTVNARSFYWATTGAVVDGAQQSARLYKVTFDSLTQPTGGTIDVVVDSATLTGTDGEKARGFDNITVNGAGSCRRPGRRRGQGLHRQDLACQSNDRIGRADPGVRSKSFRARRRGLPDAGRRKFRRHRDHEPGGQCELVRSRATLLPGHQPGPLLHQRVAGRRRPAVSVCIAAVSGRQG